MMATLDSQSDKSLCHLDKHASAELGEIPSDRGLPAGLYPLESQVAGHQSDEKAHTIGMLHRSDGCVLKPITKPHLGKREITFYENLRKSEDPVMLQLRKYVPKYYGTTELQIFGRRVTFLTLKDITEGMAEPCVMDIKIGRRTWDPQATPQKRANEDRKYAESKRIYGFCITGFQVYCLSSGELRKFGTHYGKNLDAKGVVEALKIFLNISPERPPCRQLIVKLLSFLWKVLLLFRTQRIFRFYSSSLLVAYDARRLRDCTNDSSGSVGTSSARTVHSFSPMNSHAVPSNVFKEIANDTSNRAAATSATMAARDRTTCRSHFVQRSMSLSTEETGRDESLKRSGSCSTDFGLDRLCRTHSLAKNFDDGVAKMKQASGTVMNELGTTLAEDQDWVRIKMIDFTHVFPADDPRNLDENYLEGIQNLIKLVEMFLTPKNTKT